mgnify:CR=1 FL=1
MELNKLILFLIIIFLSIIIFKCAKIFNIKKIEKFSFRGQKGFTDNSGHVSSFVDNMLNDTTYLRCDGDWGSCSNQSGCQQIYNITTDNYIGDPCPHASGAISECIPDLCAGSSGETYSFEDSNGDITEYHIKRNTTITHTRGNSDEDLGFEEYNPTAEVDDSWASIGDETNINIQLRANIQLQKLNRIMESYNDDPNFIGIQKKEDSTGDKFYPIIVYENSVIEESIQEVGSAGEGQRARSVLYMKLNRDCRGTWSDCYESTTMDNVESGSQLEGSSILVVQRDYTINIPAIGNGSACEAANGDIQNCAYWSACTDIQGETQGLNASYWTITNPDICDNGENNPCNDNEVDRSKIDHCAQSQSSQ